MFLVALCALYFLGGNSCTFKVVRENDPLGTVPAPADSSAGTAEAGNGNAAIQPGVIGPGDLLEITVYGEKGLTGLYQVSPEGIIVFPFIGNLSVVGMTNFSLAERIAEKLRNGYVRDPQVSVFVKEFNSRRVFVLGQVKNAGRIAIIHDLSVIEAIALAGGFTNLADINNVIITRRDASGREMRLVVDIEAMLAGKAETFRLLPGDIVFVRERFF